MARLNTSDVGTWHDVFDEDKAYHRPPAWFKPKVIIDLGAYVGYTTVDFAQKFPNAIIKAVEPDSDNYTLLVFNTLSEKKYKNVDYINKAVSNYIGTGHLSYDAYNARKLVNGSNVWNVYVTTLDDIVKNLKHIDYIKFDIEGAEREVFKTGGEWNLKTFCIKAELHGDYSKEEAISDLTILGFSCIEDDRHPNAVVGVRE